MAVKKVIEIDVNTLNAQGGLDKFVDTLKQTEEQSVSLKTELRQLKQQLAELPEGTAEYDKIAKRAGEVSDQIGDINTKVKNLGSDTKGIDAIVQGAQTLSGAFSVASSASALLGDENEDLQKTMLKVESAIGLTVGIQSIANALQKESALVLGVQSVATKVQIALQTAYTAVVGTSTGALKALKVALISTGIGAFVVLLGSLIASMSSSTDATEELTDAQKRYNNALEDGKKLTEDRVKASEYETQILLANAKKRGAGERELLSIELDGIKERGKANAKEYEDIIAKQSDEYKRTKEQNDRLENLRKENIDLQRKGNVLIANFEADFADKQRDAEKKRLEDNKKLSEEQAKKLLEIEKKKHEDLIKENENYWNKYLELGSRKVADEQANKVAFNELDLENTAFNNQLLLDKFKENADKQIEIEKNKLEQKKAIQDSELQLLDNFVGFFKELAGKNKALQKAAIIAESALGIAKMVIANNAANAGALATPQAILTSGASAVPVIARNNISTAFGIGASIVATAKALSSLGGGGTPSAGGTQGSSGGGGGGSPPQFNVVGNAGVNQIASTLGKEQPPMQAYVVAGAVATQQSLSRNIVANASI